MSRELQVGDFVRCRDKADMIATMMDLQDQGIETAFAYEHKGETGLWLEVTYVEED